MDTFKQTLIKQLTSTIQKQFNEPEIINPVKLERGITNLYDYVGSLDNIMHNREDLITVMKGCGLKNMFKLSDVKLEQLMTLLFFFITKFYFKNQSLNFSISFKEEKREVATSKIKTIDTAPSVSINAPILSADLGKTGYEYNLRIKPGFDRLVKSENKIVDDFIYQSFLLNYHYKNFESLSKFQKFQLKTLSKYLYEQQKLIAKEIREQDSSRFSHKDQSLFADYMECLYNNNATIFHTIDNGIFIPYMLELNGMPGIGKSSCIHLLREIVNDFMPYIPKEDMIYSRVNDKFWNGYRHQPIVLFDDQNQNKKIAYNLDNEIIAIGGGTFVHPPMAYEKDMKFSSLFVVFTTNTKLLETTEADKGAIERRIETVTVTSSDKVGKIEGNKWKYFPGVRLSSIYLSFDAKPINFILNSFLTKILEQQDYMIPENPFDFYFQKIEEIKQVGIDYKNVCNFFANMKDDGIIQLSGADKEETHICINITEYEKSLESEGWLDGLKKTAYKSFEVIGGYSKLKWQENKIHNLTTKILKESEIAAAAEENNHEFVLEIPFEDKTCTIEIQKADRYYYSITNVDNNVVYEYDRSGDLVTFSKHYKVSPKLLNLIEEYLNKLSNLVTLVKPGPEMEEEARKLCSSMKIRFKQLKPKNNEELLSQLSN